MSPLGVSVTMDAPPISPPANGLLASAPVIEHNDDRWINGIGFEADACGGGVVFDPCSYSYDTSGFNSGGARSFQPFGAAAFAKCSTFGFTDQDYEGKARRALARVESALVEHEFWTGTLNADNRHLATNGNDTHSNPWTTVLGGGALGLANGLATLVQGIADYGLGRGMIHARPKLVTRWAGLGLLVRENGKIFTHTGSIVVPGSGYPGTAPAGTSPTATAEWAYATEVVQVERGPMEVPAPGVTGANVDRVNNTVTVTAQRMYSVRWNACAVLTAQINPTNNA